MLQNNFITIFELSQKIGITTRAIEKQIHKDFKADLREIELRTMDFQRTISGISEDSQWII